MALCPEQEIKVQVKRELLDEGTSFLALNHDDMVTEFGFDRRICVDRFVDGAFLKSKGGILEFSNHRAPSHPAKVTLNHTIKVRKQINTLSKEQ